MSLGAQLSRVLADLQGQCSGIRGTVIATSDGFVLAAAGVLENETAAATAVHVTQVVEQHLGLLQPSPYREQIIWTDNALWYICGLAGTNVMMVLADAHCTAGMLRMVCRNIGDALNHALAGLE